MALPSSSAGCRTTPARGRGLSAMRTFGKVLPTRTAAARRCRFRPRISRWAMTASRSTCARRIPRRSTSITWIESGNVVANSVTLWPRAWRHGATQLAVDHAGNLFLRRESYDRLSPMCTAFEKFQPAPPTIVGDGTGTAESALTRVDQGGWNGINGMFIDPQGNMYFGSTNNISYGGQADGVFMIPNEGTPTSPNLVWNDTVMVSPVDGGYPPMVDKRGFVWIATELLQQLGACRRKRAAVRHDDPADRDGHLFVFLDGAVEAGRFEPRDFSSRWAERRADHGLLSRSRAAER